MWWCVYYVVVLPTTTLRGLGSMLTFWVSNKYICIKINIIWLNVAFFLSMCHLWMQGVPRCGCGATFLCFLGKCHIWFKTTGLNPDGDENNNNNNKRNGVYWIIYTPYVTSLHKLSSSISQFCSGKQFLLQKITNPVLILVMAQAFSAVTWCFEGTFGSFECTSSLKVVFFSSSGSICLDLRAVWRQM